MNTGGTEHLGIVGILIIFAAYFALFIFMLWKPFVKAGKPGWASFIPIYNVIVFIQLCGKPIWWFFLLFVPVIDGFVWLFLCIECAKKFDKSTNFAVGLVVLPVIFFPILGFGKAIYSK
jgi:hypothetical protein